VSRSRTGGKIERGDRARVQRVDGGRGGGGGLAHGARLKSKYRVDGERLGRPGRRRAQPVRLGAVPAGRPHAARVTLENSCGRGGDGCGGGRSVAAGRAVQLHLSVGVMVLVLLVMVVPVLLLVQFEQLRQSGVVLLEQRILQHHHSPQSVVGLYTRNIMYYKWEEQSPIAPSTVYVYMTDRREKPFSDR